MEQKKKEIFKTHIQKIPNGVIRNPKYYKSPKDKNREKRRKAINSQHKMLHWKIIIEQ